MYFPRTDTICPVIYESPNWFLFLDAKNFTYFSGIRNQLKKIPTKLSRIEEVKNVPIDKGGGYVIWKGSSMGFLSCEIL